MMPSHITALCTRIQAGYQVDELLRYSAEGQDSPEYISFHRVERLAEVHIRYQQRNAEVTQTFGEDTGCQYAIYVRLLGCETRLLMALVSSFWRTLSRRIRARILPGTERMVTAL